MNEQSSSTAADTCQPTALTAATPSGHADEIRRLSSLPQWAWLTHFERRNHPDGLPSHIDVNEMWTELARSDSLQRHDLWEMLSPVLSELWKWKRPKDKSWENSRFRGQLPPVGSPSALMAIRLLSFMTTDGQGPDAMGVIWRALEMDHIFEDPLKRKVPVYWQGADFDDPVWRVKNVNLNRPQPKCERPFIDLNDLFRADRRNRKLTASNGLRTQVGARPTHASLQPDVSPQTEVANTPQTEVVSASIPALADPHMNNSLLQTNTVIAFPAIPGENPSSHTALVTTPAPSCPSVTTDDSAVRIKTEESLPPLSSFAGAKKKKKKTGTKQEALKIKTESFDSGYQDFVAKLGGLEQRHADLAVDVGDFKQNHRGLVARIAAVEQFNPEALECKVDQQALDVKNLVDRVSGVETRLMNRLDDLEQTNYRLRAEIKELREQRKEPWPIPTGPRGGDGHRDRGRQPYCPPEAFRGRSRSPQHRDRWYNR